MIIIIEIKNISLCYFKWSICMGSLELMPLESAQSARDYQWLAGGTCISASK